ncbi:MAG: crossover junction endodeoxyribonuclease RuvC [Limisphaerales bacterium]
MSAKQFAELQERAAGKRRNSADVPAARKSVQHSVIIGIDPSLRGTGFGVIQLGKDVPDTLAQGTIKCHAKWEHSRCLLYIAEQLRDVVKENKPTVCVMEGIFFAQNLKTAIVMGQARGAAIVPVAEAGLEIYEIATRKVKQAIVGFGGAQKAAVAKMVQRMLGLKTQPAPDAADALALALAHANDMSRPALKPPKKI